MRIKWSRGVRILDENADRYDLLFNQKPSSIFSTMSEIMESIGPKKIPNLLVSEYLPGPELTIDTSKQWISCRLSN